MLKIPAFFFPTTVLILDDDKNFSRILKVTLGKDCYTHTFSNPNDLFTYLKQISSTTTSPRLSNSDKVRSFIDSGTSQNLISVIVTDYQLDDMTGIEVLNQVKLPSVQKLLISNFRRKGHYSPGL